MPNKLECDIIGNIHPLVYHENLHDQHIEHFYDRI